MNYYLNINVLLGQTLTKINGDEDRERLEFTTATGKKYLMYHSQDCCETVQLAEVVGDLADIVGSPILRAEERT